MFLTDCQACGLRELRGPRSIELLVNRTGSAPGSTDSGVEIVYRCTRCATLNVLDVKAPASVQPTTQAPARQPSELAVASAA